MNKKIVIMLGSFAGAIMLGIAMAITAYFTLQYATETQVQAAPAQVEAQEIAVTLVEEDQETQSAKPAPVPEVPVADEVPSSPPQRLPTPASKPIVEPALRTVMLARIVPDGWIDYQIVDSGVIFAYPPHWNKADEDPNSVTFVPDSNQTVLVVAAKDGSFIQIMADGSTEMLKRGVLTFTPADVDVTFNEEGILAAPFRPAYLTALMHVDGQPVSMLTTYATDGRQILLVLLMNNGLSTISETDFAMVTQLIQSVSFGQDTQIDPTIVDQETVNLMPVPTAVPSSINAQKSVNLRQGPGTTYSVVGSLEPEDRFQIVARNQDGDWYQIRAASGEIAWVAAFLVESVYSITDIPVAKNMPPSVAAPAAAPVLAPPVTK